MVGGSPVLAPWMIRSPVSVPAGGFGLITEPMTDVPESAAKNLLGCGPEEPPPPPPPPQAKSAAADAIIDASLQRPTRRVASMVFPPFQRRCPVADALVFLPVERPAIGTSIMPSPFAQRQYPELGTGVSS